MGSTGVSRQTSQTASLPDKSELDGLERQLIRRAKSRERRARLSRFYSPALVLTGLLVAWDVVVRALSVPTYLVPAPDLVARTLVAEWPLLWENSLTTWSAIAVGFFSAVVGGVVLALLTFGWKPFERGVYPLIVALQAVPKVAVAPLFAIWFGFSLTTRSLMAFLLAVFPVLVSMLVGLRSIDQEKVLLARSMGLGPFQTFWKIRLPQSLPSLFGGMKVALVLASVGAIVGEYLGGAGGLGYIIQRATHEFATPRMFAALTVLGAFAFLLYLLVEALERWLLPWHLEAERPIDGG